MQIYVPQLPWTRSQSGHILAGSFAQFLQGYHQGDGCGYVSPLGLGEGLGSCSKIIQIVGRIVIWGCTTEVPVYLLVIGWDSSQLLEAACSSF